jgi:hypothetical protein
MDPNIRTIIDNSKKTAWAKKYLHDDAYELKFIHLIRDPRALVRRWLINNDTPQKRREKRLQLARHHLFFAPWILKEQDEEMFAYKWMVDNREITKFIHKNRLDSRLVTYRDLVHDAGRQISRIVDWLGYEFEPDQLNYWKFVHHGSRKKDYDFVGKTGERVFDLRWKTYLKPHQERRITENRYLKQYIDELTLELVDDGLTYKRS